MTFIRRLFKPAKAKWDHNGQPIFEDAHYYDDENEYSDTEVASEEQTDERPAAPVEHKPQKPRQVRITGDDVLYFIPDDMKALIVQIQDENGKVKNQYTLTNYLSMSAGERVRLIVKK